MIVVSDTSPVLNLARIGRLNLLQSLYDRVLIPSAVFGELTDSRSDQPPAVDLASMPWLIVATPTDQKRVEELREELDAGEAEAIVLAIERICCLWTKGAGVGRLLRPGSPSPAFWESSRGRNTLD